MARVTLAKGPRVSSQIQDIRNVFAPQKLQLCNPKLPGVFAPEFVQFGQRLPEPHKADILSGDPQNEAVKFLAREHIVFLHDPLTPPASLALEKNSVTQPT
jgi:hypothetical protein